MGNNQFTLLVGSPRKKGTSFSFARTIQQLSAARGMQSDILFIIDYYDGKENIAGLKDILEKSDIIGLVTPMYVDTLPAPVIWFLEKLSAGFKNELKDKRFFTISQCGFPDITLLQPPLESCRFFARASGMKWLGGLGYGGGAIINGVFMEDLGKKGKTITTGFKMAVEDIIADKQVRPEVQDVLDIKVPKIAFGPMAFFLNYRTRKLAEKHGVKKLKGKILLE